MLKKFRTKILPILLIFVMLFCSMGAATENWKKFGQTTATENGIIYYIEGFRSGNKLKVITKTNKEADYSETIINQSNKTITSITYDYKGKGLLGTSRYNKTSEIIDYSVYDQLSASSVTLQALTYKSKITEKWPCGNDYWFARGTDGAKTYLKIGSIASYQIRTDTLYGPNFTMCETYANDIKNCNVQMNLAIGADVTGIIGCVVGMICSGLAAAAIIFVLGCVAAIVTFAIIAYGYYCDAKDLYNVIKTYGTKI